MTTMSLAQWKSWCHHGRCDSGCCAECFTVTVAVDRKISDTGSGEVLTTATTEVVE